MKKIVILSVLCVILISIAFAETRIPHQFYGEVTVNGQPAPDNLLVTAKISGVEVAATITREGKYGYTPEIFYVRDPTDNSRTGDLIEFYVNNIKGGEAIFANGDSTRLDLAITQETGGGSGGGGGGGGSSNIVVQTLETEESNITDEECVPDWVCSDWLDCVNGAQKRVCVDSNKCDDESSEPNLLQACEVKKTTTQTEPISPEGKKEEGLFGITGAVSGLIPGGSLVPTITLVVLVVALLIFVWYKWRK